MAYSDPLAFFITWPTYGTWLPGDERGWVEYRQGWQLPNPMLELESAARMTEDARILTSEQRVIVDRQVHETSGHKGWVLHAVECRSNHMHIVVTAVRDPKIVRDQIKAWCSRRLNEHQARIGIPKDERRTKWWVERGSIRWIWNDSSLLSATEYVVVQQDNPHRFSQPAA